MELTDNARAISPSWGTPAAGVLDFKATLQHVEGDFELFREMAQLFCEDIPGRLARLSDSFRRRDFDTLREVAHSLKGAAEHFGAMGTSKVALDLEESARGRDLAHSAMLKAGLERDLQTLRRELELHLV